MGASKGSKQTIYTKELKLEAIRMNLVEGKGSRIIARELGLRSRALLVNWVRAYRMYGEQGLEDARGRRRHEAERPPQRPAKPFKDKYSEIEYLRAEVAYLKKLQEIERGDSLNRTRTRQ